MHLSSEVKSLRVQVGASGTTSLSNTDEAYVTPIRYLHRRSESFRPERPKLAGRDLHPPERPRLITAYY